MFIIQAGGSSAAPQAQALRGPWGECPTSLTGIGGFRAWG